MKKYSLILLVALFVTYFSFDKYKEYTARIYLLEKSVEALNKNIIRKDLLRKGFKRISEKSTEPIVRVLSHTYVFNKRINKNAPRNKYFQPLNVTTDKFPHVFVGDFIWGDTPDDLRLLKKYQADKNIFLIKGNHETLSSVNKLIKDNFDFKIGDFHFIAVTMKQTREGKIEHSEESISFLNNFVNQSDKKNEKLKRVVLTHHNIFSNELNSNLPFQDIETLRRKIMQLKPFAIIVGDGGAKDHELQIEKEGVKIFLTGFPYVNADSPPKWIDLYPSHMSIMVAFENEVYEKKIDY